MKIIYLTFPPLYTKVFSYLFFVLNETTNGGQIKPSSNELILSSLKKFLNLFKLRKEKDNKFITIHWLPEKGFILNLAIEEKLFQKKVYL